MANMLSISETQAGVNQRFLSDDRMEVLQSDDYSSFELDEDNNRMVKQSQVVWLSKEIRRDGQIEPIIVKLNPKNGKKVIHGGQHRFKACMMLGIPVRYIIQNAMDDNDMVKVHVNHLAFGWKDYLSLYLKKGIESYKRYNELLNDLTITMSTKQGTKEVKIGHDTLLGLLYWRPDGRKVGGQFWDSNVKDPEKNHKLAFQQGLLEFSAEQERFVRRFVNNIDRLQNHIAPKWRHAVLRDKLLFVAIQRIWTDENWRKTKTKPETSWFGFDKLIEFLDKSGSWIERGHSYEDYLDQFEEILSYGRTRRNRVFFNV